MALRLFEGGARFADGDGHEFYLPPHRLESGDERCVFNGLLLKPHVASEVLADSDLDNYESALFSFEGTRVRHSSG